jgi:hypothetical protein
LINFLSNELINLRKGIGAIFYQHFHCIDSKGLCLFGGPVLAEGLRAWGKVPLALSLGDPAWSPQTGKEIVSPPQGVI